MTELNSPPLAIKLKSDSFMEPALVSETAAELRRTRQRLEQVERLLACFQKALGHELPNQLVALRGLAQMLELEDAQRLGAAGRDYLGRLAAVSQRVHTLVSGLADAGRAFRDRQPAEEVGIEEVAREAAAEIAHLYPGQIIGYHFQEPRPFLTVSRSALRQVLVQLLRNAARSGIAGRPVRIDIGGRHTPTGVEFWVKDDGRGLSPERRQRLFEPFPGSDGPAGGNGLGLFLVRLLVEDRGGTVQAKSEPGKGSVFTVTFDGVGAKP